MQRFIPLRQVAVVGVTFTNSSTVTGAGNYYLNSTTTNNSNFGNDAGGINFYTKNLQGSNKFTNQNTNPHSSVTKNNFTPPDTNWNGGALPVKLISFKANLNNDDVKIEWITATEENNDHFDIERSVDNGEFEKISTIQGAGNSMTILKYNFEDKNVKKFDAHDIIYRLKQIDFDGQETFKTLAAISLLNDKNKKATIEITDIFPNPFSSAPTVKLESADGGEYTLNIFDIAGKLQITSAVNLAAGNTSYVLNETEKLIPGNYILSFTNSAVTKTLKIVKSGYSLKITPEMMKKMKNTSVADKL